MLALALTALATAAAMAAPPRHRKPTTDDNAESADADDATPRKEKPRKAEPRARTKKQRDALSVTVEAIEREDAAADRQTAARDGGTEPDAVVVDTAKAVPKKYRNEFYFVAGMAHVDARVSSGGLQLDPAGLASLAAPMGPVQGSVESDPANIVAGMIGFAPAALHGYIAFETLIGIPTTSQLRATGDLANKSLAPTALGFVPTGIPPLGSQLGEAKAVPPMLTAIVRLPELGPIRFYIGGGASVLFVTDAKITNPVLTEVATPTLEVTPAFGVVGQVGVDIHIFDRFSARIDVKELWFQPSEATISNIRVHTMIPLLETVDVGSAKSEFQANPIIVQGGIRASF